MQAPSIWRTMTTYDNVSGGGAIIFSAVSSGVVIRVVSVMVVACGGVSCCRCSVGVGIVEI
jgi:hypothetical protein